MTVFKKYDIRGIYPSEINGEFALRLGKAIGSFFEGKGTLVVGRDVRQGGDILKENLIRGILSTGCDVIDIDFSTTPLIGIATYLLNCKGGIMVTASHNPKEYQGFKIFSYTSPLSYETGIGKIEEIFKKEIFLQGKGNLEKKNILEDYIKFLLSRAEPKKEKKIVIDCMQGSTSFFVKPLLEEIGIEFDVINDKPNPHFPCCKGVPNPENEENLALLKEKVRDEEANLGFAFDGDGDRLAVVDSNGNLVPPYKIFCILSEHFLEKNYRNFVVNIAMPTFVREFIESKGGEIYVSKVGRSYVVEEMKNRDAFFAAEISGHYFFKDIFYLDDAFFCMLKILEIDDFEARARSLPDVYTEEIKIPAFDEQKDIIMKKIEEILKDYTLITLDGIKVQFESGSILIRKSNTEPVIKVVIEGTSKAIFDQIKKFYEDIIKKEIEEIQSA